MALGDNIKRMREKHHLTQQMLADKPVCVKADSL